MYCLKCYNWVSPWIQCWNLLVTSVFDTVQVWSDKTAEYLLLINLAAIFWRRCSLLILASLEDYKVNYYSLRAP